MPSQLIYHFRQFYATFLSERENWILWLPVFFGIGIIIYFSLPFEPPITFAIVATILPLAISYYLRFHRALMWLAIIVALIAAGFLTANLRALTVNAPMLEKTLGVKNISGKIYEVHTRPHGKRFVIENPLIEGISADQTPKRVRLNVNTGHSNAVVGDIISTLAALNPPPKAVIPGGYNYSRHAYFEQIGAVGYAVADITVTGHSTQSSFYTLIARLRQTITERILASAPAREGNIATALLVGERGGIAENDLQDMRDAGLAHLLAISGMHLALVATIFFFSARTFLAFFERITLRYNIKKWAVFVAIVGSFFYLLISGAPISAQRAFIMSTLFLTALLIDRSGTPIRSVAFAAMLVLLVSPESILTPSFQMSFAAVIALVSTFNYGSSLIANYAGFGFIRKILLYVLSLMVASLVAGAATAPFAMYHFNHFSSYSVLANLIAVPLTSFVIMPLGVITLLLMPFGLEAIALLPMLKGIDLVLLSASLVASLPNATSILPSMAPLALGMFTFGGLWLCLWQKKWRLYSIIPISCGVSLMFYAVKPDIIVSGEGEVFALRGSDDTLLFSSLKKERYSQEMWLKRFGQKESYSIAGRKDPIINCDSISCLYKKNNYLTAIVNHPNSLYEDCPKVDILINLTHLPTPCRTPSVRLDTWNLRKNGTYALYLDDPVRIQNTSHFEGDRLWSR